MKYWQFVVARYFLALYVFPMRAICHLGEALAKRDNPELAARFVIRRSTLTLNAISDKLIVPRHMAFISSFIADRLAVNFEDMPMIEHHREAMQHSKEAFDRFSPLFMKGDPNFIIDTYVKNKELAPMHAEMLRYKSHPIYKLVDESMDAIGYVSHYKKYLKMGDYSKELMKQFGMHDADF